MPTPFTKLSLSTLMLACATMSALAQSESGSKTPTAQPSSDWQYSLGAGLISAPYFLGSDKQRTRVLPTFQIRYQDWFFIDPLRGIGVQSKLAEGLTGSAAVGLDLAERKTKDDARVAGLGDISMAPAVRLGLNYSSGRAFVNSQLSSRLGDANGRGTLLDADVGYHVVASRSAIVGLGLNVKGMDNAYAQHFFGVSAAQAGASGFTAFQAKGGLLSSGLFVQTVVPLSGQWTFFGRAVQSQLSGDAASSPITKKSNQTLLVTSLNYSF